MISSFIFRASVSLDANKWLIRKRLSKKRIKRDSAICQIQTQKPCQRRHCMETSIVPVVCILGLILDLLFCTRCVDIKSKYGTPIRFRQVGVLGHRGNPQGLSKKQPDLNREGLNKDAFISTILLLPSRAPRGLPWFRDRRRWARDKIKCTACPSRPHNGPAMCRIGAAPPFWVRRLAYFVDHPIQHALA